MLKATFLTLLICLPLFGKAQVHSHAIGFRGGNAGYYGNGGELSYQLGLSDQNRIEFDLGFYGRRKWNNGKGWGSDGFRILSFSAIYHWIWNIKDGLNWYVGPGAQIIFYDEYYHDDHDGIFLNLGGQIGLEYDFSQLGAPLQLGLDYRPMFLFGWYHGFGHNTALSLRFLID